MQPTNDDTKAARFKLQTTVHTGAIQRRVKRLLDQRSAKLLRAEATKTRFSCDTHWRIMHTAREWLRVARYRHDRETIRVHKKNARNLLVGKTQRKQKRPDERVADDTAWKSYATKNEGWRPPVRREIHRREYRPGREETRRRRKCIRLQFPVAIGLENRSMARCPHRYQDLPSHLHYSTSA